MKRGFPITKKISDDLTKKKKKKEKEKKEKKEKEEKEEEKKKKKPLTYSREIQHRD